MTGLIILAAGASTRLGQPKQNLKFRDKTLLQRMVEIAIASTCRPVIVVIGANADSILPVENCDVIYNANWEEGMASSIRIGMSEIIKNKAIDNVVIMLCDQPFVSTSLIDTIVQKQIETGKPIIACTYSNAVGVPALFNRSLFDELLLLKGNEGAKSIFKVYPNKIITVPFPEGSIDIDTMNDYEYLN
jgi:molybdenum cofactor cytidylyltransferase